MARYCFYIDGFNVYYAIRQRYSQYKWLDYQKLALSAVGSKDTIEAIYYFSSYVTWKPDAVARHKEYIKVLRSVGVEYIQGRFKNKTLACHHCQKQYKSHEEKQTDVNIAVKIAADVAEDKFDKTVIVSADTDLIPAIKTVHKIRPEKEIGVMFPVGRNSFELRHEADFILKMKPKRLVSCQFPTKVKIGNDIIECPPEWQ